MALKDGKLTVTTSDASVYGGVGNVRIVLDAADVPAVELSGTLSGVQAGPFLAAAIGVTRLDGAAAATVQASGRGNSERDIVATLAGGGRFQVQNGAIHGVDLPASLLSAMGALL